MRKTLAAFDFDHTIIDDNSDTAAVSLVGKNNIPQEVKDLQYRAGWTSFMQGIFNLLFEQGVNENTIKELVENLPLVTGMFNLIKELKKTGSYDIIIISDCNSYFIKTYLQKHNLANDVMKIFTNPAKFVNGKLIISPYHDQTSCKLSTRNLCKGQILEEFVNEQQKKAVVYDRIVYVGDGVNDFCPTLRLSKNDVICARNKYKLHDLILKAQAGKSFDNSGMVHNIKADIVVWDDGDDILQKIKK
ncbi:Put Phosphatase and/or HAD domain containing protein [Asbolus verrucosus]|uniref:Put Phosphatase and/or HAD domain containing protein n=1 Tax=Asbolus verrucosus TaxID=1661398 RepID=A0A482W9S6_ASBVE|nr:Put Phosphatase and/or HAD domain containing protein [Asbolus verrucosus]